MSNKLQETLDAIKLEKDTNLLPENIKKDVKIFDIVGTLEEGASTNIPVKLFETEEAMQADTTAKEGDLAVVYRSEIQNATADSRFQVATFPDTVVLDTAITSSVEVRYRAVDSSKMFYCMGRLDSSRFRMDCYTETGEVRIQYTSSDGITYTRTDTTGNPVDFGTEIYYAYADMWNDAIGKFIQVGGNTFEGLYKYISYQVPNLVLYSLDINNYDFNNLTYTGNKTYQNNLQDVFNTIINNNYDMPILFLTSDLQYGYGIRSTTKSDGSSGNRHSNVLHYFNNKMYKLTGDSVTSQPYVFLHKFNMNDGSLVSVTDISSTQTTSPFQYSRGVVPLPEDATYFIISMEDMNFANITSYNDSNSEADISVSSTEYTTNYKYMFAPTQLNATSDYVYGKEFYGKDGVETGTLTQGVSNSFTDLNAEIYSKIQNAYDNMQPRILTDTDKTIDDNTLFVPAKFDGTPLLDTSNMTNMNNLFAYHRKLIYVSSLDTSNVTSMVAMFDGCTNLTKISLLDTSKVTGMTSMFYGCTNLTEIPLLNTNKVTDMSSMFQDCKKLVTIPLLNTSSVDNIAGMFQGCTNLTEIPSLDISSVTNMNIMFQDCSKLTTIPLLNTSKVTGMLDTFKGCTSLSDESLNNILAMCKNATSYTGTKTLKYIGLTSNQANRCKTLSNYSAFTAAGWTTGY